MSPPFSTVCQKHLNHQSKVVTEEEMVSHLHIKDLVVEEVEIKVVHLELVEQQAQDMVATLARKQQAQQTTRDLQMQRVLQIIPHKPETNEINRWQ